MANEEHLAILKQGVKAWNQWQKEYRDVKADLSYADLSYAKLSAANLIGANLSAANLRAADLSYANLREANLRAVNLRAADLSYANLRAVNLSAANLSAADLTNAQVGWTTFGKVVLSQVKGLETVRHRGPSTIGIDTTFASKGDIPHKFLLDAGVPQEAIDYLLSLAGKAIDFYSCFISYSSQDEEFAERLHADLQDKGVRCWFAPHDQRIGEPIIRGIDEAIRVHEKTLLILSEHSVSSRWVELEVEMASAKELQSENPTTALFPIRIDEAVMQTSVMWADTIRRTRHIGDFTQWKDHDSYQAAFDRLLRDLKGEG